MRILPNKGLVVAPQGLATGTVAAHFQSLVGRNTVEPRLDGGVLTEVRQPFEGRNEDVLRHLLGGVLIEQIAGTVAQNGTLVLLDEHLQRVRELPLGDVVLHRGITERQRLAQVTTAVHDPCPYTPARHGASPWVHSCIITAPGRAQRPSARREDVTAPL